MGAYLDFNNLKMLSVQNEKGQEVRFARVHFCFLAMRSITKAGQKTAAA